MIYSIQCGLSKNGRGSGRNAECTHRANTKRQRRPIKPGLIAPDTSGMNFYRADPALADLLRIHLSDELFRHIEPHLDRLGGSGRRSSRRMRAACRPPRAGAAPARPFWPRRAMDRISSGLSRTGEGRVRRVRHPRDVAAQGHHGLAADLSGGGKTRLYVSVQPGRVRARLSDQRHRRLRQAAVEFRRCRAEGKISRRPDADRHGQAHPGRPVHDREGRRLRRRQADHDRRTGRRSLAADRREMVLLQCGCQGRHAAGAAARRGRRHPRRRAVPDAALSR